MTRFASILLFAAAIVPFVLATNGNQQSSDCGQDEFFFETKSCCLPNGGPQNPPSPPKGVNCPVSGWYWHTGKQCCVPSQPTKPSSPPPQCPKECFWSSLDLKCYPGTQPSQPSSPPPKPSSQPGYNNGNNHWRRRSEMKARTVPLCLSGLEACPIPGFIQDFECVDTNTDLQSCGGCVALSTGQDCTKIEGVMNVACNAGTCVVSTCQSGFKVASNGQSCIKL